MLLLLTTLLRVKVNMKARGVSQIFALWLILMYIHVYLNFQVYPELVPTGHKWTSSKISKSNIGTGASFFTTISQPLNGVQAFLFFPCFSSLSPILSPSVEEEETFFLSTPMEVSLFTILVLDWHPRVIIPILQTEGTGTEMKSFAKGQMIWAQVGLAAGSLLLCKSMKTYAFLYVA